MSKTALVKIGVPSEQATGMRRLRRIRQILEQHDAGIARLEAATHERIREALADDAAETAETATDEQTRAAS